MLSLLQDLYFRHFLFEVLKHDLNLQRVLVRKQMWIAHVDFYNFFLTNEKIGNKDWDFLLLILCKQNVYLNIVSWHKSTSSMHGWHWKSTCLFLLMYNFIIYRSILQKKNQIDCSVKCWTRLIIISFIVFEINLNFSFNWFWLFF